MASTVAPERVTASSRALKGIESRLPSLRTASDITNLGKQIEAVNEGYQDAARDLESTGRDIDGVTNVLATHFGNANRTVASLIRRRDDVLANSRKATAAVVDAEKSTGRRKDATVKAAKKRVTKFEQDIDRLESEAERFFGVRVSADAFATLTVANRTLSRDEKDQLKRVEDVLEDHCRAVKRLAVRNRQLQNVTDRALDVLRDFTRTKFSDIESAGVKGGDVGKVDPLARKAVGQVAGLVRNLKSQEGRIKALLSKCEQVHSGVKRALRRREPDTTLSIIANLGGVVALAGGVAALSIGTPVVGVVGGLLAVGGIATRLVALTIAQIRAVFIVRQRKGRDE